MKQHTETTANHSSFHHFPLFRCLFCEHVSSRTKLSRYVFMRSLLGRLARRSDSQVPFISPTTQLHIHNTTALQRLADDTRRRLDLHRIRYDLTFFRQRLIFVHRAATEHAINTSLQLAGSEQFSVAASILQIPIDLALSDDGRYERSDGRALSYSCAHR